MISDDSPTIQSDRQKGPKGLIQCPQRFLEPFSGPPKLTNWSISPWLPFVEHGDGARWRPNLPGIILMSATMQHETFQKWPRFNLGGKRRRSHTIYSLHLFTSLYISLHLFTSLYISLHLATKTDMQNVRKMLIQNLARVIHLKQNKTELVRSFKSDDIEPKKSKESIKTESCHCCFLSATQSWRLARVGKLDDQRLPFLTLLSGTSLYCVLII